MYAGPDAGAVAPPTLCAACGSTLAVGARYCWACGTPIAGEALANLAAPATAEAPPRPVPNLFVQEFGFILIGDALLPPPPGRLTA